MTNSGPSTAQPELFSSSVDNSGKTDARIRPGSRFGSKVRELRLRHHIAQRELADRLGVSSAYLSQLESGKKGRPSDRLIHAICHQFGLIWDEADDLFVLADNSRRVIKIDASTLDERKTEAARLFAEKLPKLTRQQLDQVLDLIEEL